MEKNNIKIPVLDLEVEEDVLNLGIGGDRKLLAMNRTKSIIVRGLGVMNKELKKLDNKVNNLQS